MTAILVGTFVFISAYNYKVSSESVRKDILQSALPLTRDNIYSELQASLTRPIFVSSLMANDTFLKDWSMDGENGISKIKRYLDEIREKYGFFSSFFVSASTRNYYYYDGILKKISKKDSHDVWYYDFIKKGTDYDLIVDTNEAEDNILTIFINHRVEDRDGNLIGVTGVGLKVDAVATLLKEFSEKYDKNIYLISPDGIVQAHSNTEMVHKLKSVKSMPGISKISDKVLAIKRTEPASFEYKKDEDTILMTIRWVKELGWFLVVEQSEQKSMEAARTNLIRTVEAGFLVTIVILIISIVTVNHYQKKLEVQANTDELTGVANRRGFEHKFLAETAIAERSNSNLSLIVLDVDNFKRVNDICGHIEGDRILKEISCKINSSVRSSDFCARWGGDEFIVLVSGDVDQAVEVSKRIHRAVNSIPSCDSYSEKILGSKNVGVSSGVAMYKSGDTLDSVIMRADKAMYKAKESGRGKVYSELDI
jgi:diguanylate cyclase (GGDEF)-like protein